MILNNLKLYNFRQFKGLQEIHFSSPEYDGKNVTVIFGENGRGKTGIFRAVMFCLYGEKKLSQDEDVTQDELFLVNTPALEESSESSTPVESYVELDFQHKDENYRIKRSLLGLIDKGSRHEQDKALEFYRFDSEGNTKIIKDLDEINDLINSILNKNVREYFLFDGEKIQKLTLANVEQKREVAKGIKNLLNVDSLEKAIKATHRLKKNINAELEKKATGEYGKVIKNINELENKISINNEKIEKREEEHRIATSQKASIDKELDKYIEIKDLLKERSIKETALNEKVSEQNLILAQIKEKTGKSSLLLINKTIDDVFNKIDKKIEKGEIPSEIRKDLIERIIRDQSCICGNEVKPGTDSFNKIIEWKNKASEIELEKFVIDLWRFLSGIKGTRENTIDSVEASLHKYGLCKNNIEKLRLRIEKINEEIGTDEKKDIGKYEAQREKIIKDLAVNENDRDGFLREILAYAEEAEKLRLRKKLLEKEESIKNELSKRADMSEKAHMALLDLFEEFTSEIKEKIALAANNYLQELLDDEGKEALKKIIVNDDYSLQILDKWGRPFLANISAGQRQIMSISFIAALAKVAAADKILEMPLFMDTPFGRLSLEHRKKLVRNIPSYCAQWILLATDTEFRKQEAVLLQETGQWGSFYHLKSEAAGITKLIPRNPAEANFILAEGEGEDY